VCHVSCVMCRVGVGPNGQWSTSVAIGQGHLVRSQEGHLVRVIWSGSFGHLVIWSFGAVIWSFIFWTDRPPVRCVLVLGLLSTSDENCCMDSEGGLRP
jgi:hypothetical protein